MKYRCVYIYIYMYIYIYTHIYIYIHIRIHIVIGERFPEKSGKATAAAPSMMMPRY